jgi:hypothetical protein
MASAAADMATVMKGDQDNPAGTGAGFARIILVWTGVSCLVATLLTFM